MNKKKLIPKCQNPSGPIKYYINKIINLNLQKIKEHFFGDLSTDVIRERLYNNLSPYGYHDFKKRLKTAVIDNTPDEDIIHPLGSTRVRNDIFAEYLNIPNESRRPSLYKVVTSDVLPTMRTDRYNYKKIEGLDEYDKENLILNANDLVVGKNKIDRSLGFLFGDHTLGKGRDYKGEYVSYYDLWDINPFKGTSAKRNVFQKYIPDVDLSMGIGTPIPFYDRIYLDDYYEVPEDKRGYSFLPEVIITPDTLKNIKTNLFKQIGFKQIGFK